MATLKDVSKASGFSVTTVSRALNGYDDVNKETRDKITSVAKELGYSPNILARSLVKKQSKTIGFLVTDLKRESVKDNFMFETLCGVSDELSDLDYEFVLLSTTTSKQKNKTYGQMCAERQLDGVVIQGLKRDDPYLLEAIESTVPCVLVDIPVEGVNTGYVTSNQLESAKQAVRYLIRLGHRHIAFMNGAAHAYVSTVRYDAYRQVLQENGIEFRDDYVLNGDFEELASKSAALPFLLNHPEVTAFFCASDVMALGVLQATRELGLNVPEDLSIIGFDNILLSQYVSPPLTTVGQQPYEMGRKAASMVVHIVEGQDVPHEAFVNNELILRESVAKNRR